MQKSNTAKWWPTVPKSPKPPKAEPVHANTDKLRRVMRKYKMTSRQVAEITNRSINTVHVWRCKHPARVIPAELLKLVELSAIASQQGRK